MRVLTHWRMSRAGFLLATTALLAVFLGAVSYLGISFGLKNTLPVFATIAGLTLIMRLILAAARWRDAGLPGGTLSVAMTAVGLCACVALSPSLAVSSLVLILTVETCLPSR